MRTKIRFAISTDSTVAGRLLVSSTCSALLHGAVLAAAMAYPGSTPHGRERPLPKYRVQMLELVAPAMLPAESGDTPLGGTASRHSIFAPPTRSNAPQTLIVDGAPHKLELKQKIPLPAVISWTATRPLPPDRKQVRIDGGEAPDETAPALNPVVLQPPAVNLISLPDVLLPAQSTIAIPVVNQSAAASSTQAGAASSQGLSGQPDQAALAQAHQPASGPVSGPAPEKDAAQEASVRADRRTADQATQAASGQTAGVESQLAPEKTLARIELPQDSRPPIAVFGESVTERYSETAGQMRGRPVSSVYLRMGLKKSWILEYWTAPQAGAAKLDAPWPYLMFRPDAAFPPEADAILVRGVLNAGGQLEHLTLLLPGEWPQKELLFRALSQWKFRPASRNGQPQTVEVLLVIPRQAEE